MLSRLSVSLGLLAFTLATYLNPSVMRAQSPSGVSFISAQAIYSPQTTGLSLVAADMNRDGRVDLVTGGVSGIWIETNNGNGTFTGARVIPDFVDCFTVADVDRDGIPDLIYAEVVQGQDTLYVARGNGDGTFANPVSYVFGSAAGFIATITAVDLNGDGWPDIAIGDSAQTDNVVLFFNDKTGKFVKDTNFTITYPGSYPVRIVAADLNDDQITDLAILYEGSDELQLLFGQGAGVFANEVGYGTGGAPTGLAIASFDGKNLPILAVAYLGGVDVFSGSFSGALSGPTTFGEPGATDVLLGDFNGDGRTDIAITVQTTAYAGYSILSGYPLGNDLSHVSVYFGDGSWNFPTHRSYAVGEQPQRLIAADLNGDGNPDLIAGDALSYEAAVLYGDGYGAFQGTPIDFNSNASGMVTYDFNHDGIPDLAVVNTPVCTAPCGGTVSVMQGTGNLYLGPVVKYPIGMHGAGIAVGDVNGDGIADLVITNNTANDNYDLSVLLGNANGTFQAARNEHLGALSADAVLADVNGDHKLDLVTTAGVALGNGDGTFGAIIPFPDIASAIVTHVAVADMNKDGFLDVVVSTTAAPNTTPGDTIVTFKGNGTGNFTYFATAYPQISDTMTIGGLVVTDLNNDGYPDVAVTGANQCCGQGIGYISVLFNRKDGTINTATDDFSNVYTVANSPGGSQGRALTVGDLNGDGLPDLAMAAPGNWNSVAGYYPDSVSVLLNNGTGGKDYVSGFSPMGSFLATSGPYPSIVIADFNHDGANDIATSSQLGVSVLFNAGVLSLSPSSLSWAKVSIGQTGAPKTITFTNTGKFSLALHALVSGPGASEFHIYNNTCNATIKAGASCSVTIAFRPTSTGTQRASLNVFRPSEYNAILSTALLQGIGAQ